MSTIISAPNSYFDADGFLHQINIQGLPSDFNLLGVTLQYNINDIPNATLLYPAKVSEDINLGAPVKIEIKGKRVFDGNVTALLPSRDSGSATVRVGLTSWHSNLATSSILSTGLAASNLWDVTAPLASNSTTGTSAIPAIVLSKSPETLLASFAELLDMTRQAAKLRNMNISTSVEEIQQLLQRIRVNLKTKVDTFVEYALATFVGSVLSDTINGASIWDALSTLGDAFGVLLRPTVTELVLSPLAIQKSEIKELRPSEYSIGSIQASAIKLLRGLIFMSQGTVSISSLLPDGVKMPVGAFDSYTDGIFAPEMIPPWLNHLSWKIKDKVAQNKESSGPTNRANPVQTNTVEQNVTNQNKAAELHFNTVSTVLEDWGRWRYFIRKYSTNTVQLTGKFRLDIAPGNVVNCVIPIEKNKGLDCIGVVAGVTCELSTISHYAGTSLALNWVVPQNILKYDVVHPLFSDFIENLKLTD